VILFRPVGLTELHLIMGSRFRAFPPRLAGQEVFYPVLERTYAEQIARDWNTRDEFSGFAGFVTEFELKDTFAQNYPVRTVGGSSHRELWVPAEHVLGLNLSIVGSIRVVAAFAGPSFAGTIDSVTNLPLPPAATGPVKTIYRLKDDPQQLASIQRATLSTEKFGIEPTHGLLGSAEWWGKIVNGDLPIHTTSGVIERIYMGSMNDCPEFEVRGPGGELSRWTREANSIDLARSYAPGRQVEIDYVLQRHRKNSPDGGNETKVVVEIRISG
jgi:hypothetical protein